MNEEDATYQRGQDEESSEDRIKKLKSALRRIRVVGILLAIIIIIVLLFSIYRRYDETIMYVKPDVDATQEKIADDSSAATATTESENAGDSDYDGSFTLYSYGDEFRAESGNGTVACDVRNQANSTHDIIMRWYISSDEMVAHGISTSGVEDGRWTVAETGLFEPGYGISSVQLLPLPDGSYLPAGTYNLTLSESYYDHETGVLSSYETNIPITLEVG